MCLLPEQGELRHIVDTCLIAEGVALSLRQLDEVTTHLRSYLAGRFALPLDEI